MENHQLVPASTRIAQKKSATRSMGYVVPKSIGKRFCHILSAPAGIKTCYSVIIFLMMFTISSCKKDVIDISSIEGMPPTAKRDIYIAGYNNGKIVYWKNGVEHVLCTSDWITGDAHDIAVSGNDVYVVGKRNNNAVYWKNGVEVALTDDILGTEEATAIAINGNDIYIAGNESLGLNGSNAVYWKNGVKTILTHDPDNKQLINTRDIVINGNDVYISGTMDHTAVYWKNGAKTALSPETSAAYGMAVSGADVYVCGMEKGSPVFWKNGLKTSLGFISGCAYDVASAGDDMYFVGVENSLPTLWKNEVKTSLGSNFWNGMAIGSSGADTFVAGTIFDPLGCTAVCWANGTQTELSLVPASQGGIAMASSIAIVNH